MKINVLIPLIFILFCLIQFGVSFLLESAAIGAATLFGYSIRCKFYECCDTDNIPLQMGKLKDFLRTKLYGQQIASVTVYSAINSHVKHDNPRKPLVLSFHGLPGSGKNYLVSAIANSVFKNGEKSQHYHFFNGRNDFPFDSEVEHYQRKLRSKIEAALSACPQSVFVFDEVDKMPPKVLDILVPFMDYTSWNNREKSKSIFIFLSNTGSEQIVQRMIQLWQSGKSRDEITLQDFESLISIGAFNEKGGLFKSATIESKLIDHHVPFLPMEEKQVIECIKDIFDHWRVYHPTDEMIEEVLKHVSYGPPPHNLYSTAGCKRLDHKVSAYIHRDEFKF